MPEILDGEICDVSFIISHDSRIFKITGKNMFCNQIFLKAILFWSESASE